MLRAFLASSRMERLSHAFFLLCMVLLPCASLGRWSPHHPQVCHIWSGKSKCVYLKLSALLFSYTAHRRYTVISIFLYTNISRYYIYSLCIDIFYTHLSISITFFLYYLSIYFYTSLSLYFYIYISIYFYLIYLFLSLYISLFLSLFTYLYLSLFIYSLSFSISILFSIFISLYIHISISISLLLYINI